MRDEIEIRWTAGGFTFSLVASLNDETLTVKLAMPSQFLSAASAEQHQAYGVARDRALAEVAAALAAQREGEHHHHHPHH